MKIVALLLLLLAVAAVLSLVVMACSARAPMVRLVEGKLRPCPGTPNCVSSESETTAAIAPLTFADDPDAALERAGQAVVATGGRIQSQSGDHLWATYTSRLFRFVDDLELRLERQQRVIHVRSASRVGRSDYGVNRKRVEQLRQQFQTTSPTGDTP